MCMCVSERATYVCVYVVCVCVYVVSVCVLVCVYMYECVYVYVIFQPAGR